MTARACPLLLTLVLTIPCACDPSNPPVSSKPDASLENTYWKLAHLGDAAVVTPVGAREAQLTLTSETKRVRGFAGCNVMTGGYTLEGESLRFTPLVTTRMACAQGMDTEAAFLAALEAVRGWKIEGDTLAFTNGEGETIARFEAIYLR